jgi:hypothetical protein
MEFGIGYAAGLITCMLVYLMVQICVVTEYGENEPETRDRDEL